MFFILMKDLMENGLSLRQEYFFIIHTFFGASGKEKSFWIQPLKSPAGNRAHLVDGIPE